MAATNALVLFDIDGTLIRRAGPHHRQALVDAVRGATGVETTTDGVHVAGMLDGEILNMMMQRADPLPAVVPGFEKEGLPRGPPASAAAQTTWRGDRTRHRKPEQHRLEK